MKYTFKQKDIKKYLNELEIEPRLFPIGEIQKGMQVELEHGFINPLTNITNDDPILTLKIALAHLFEDPEYYIKLNKLKL